VLSLANQNSPALNQGSKVHLEAVEPRDSFSYVEYF
jgi:hypothetical protein